MPERFHVFDSLEDGKYINYLIEWALRAKKRDHLEKQGQGKIPEGWGSEKFWIRERIGVMRRAFAARRDSRHQVTTFEELGIKYESTNI